MNILLLSLLWTWSKNIIAITEQHKGTVYIPGKLQIERYNKLIYWTPIIHLIYLRVSSNRPIYK